MTRDAQCLLAVQAARGVIYGPLVGAAALARALGAPFVIAGAVKSVYDVAFYPMFRRVKVHQSL